VKRPPVNEELTLKVSTKHIAKVRLVARVKAAKMIMQSRLWPNRIFGACRSHSPFEKRSLCKQTPLEKAKAYVKVAILRQRLEGTFISRCNTCLWGAAQAI
jgi:hypothetical protein